MITLAPLQSIISSLDGRSQFYDEAYKASVWVGTRSRLTAVRWCHTPSVWILTHQGSAAEQSNQTNRREEASCCVRVLTPWANFRTASLACVFARQVVVAGMAIAKSTIRTVKYGKLQDSHFMLVVSEAHTTIKYHTHVSHALFKSLGSAR